MSAPARLITAYDYYLYSFTEALLIAEYYTFELLVSLFPVSIYHERQHRAAALHSK